MKQANKPEVNRCFISLASVFSLPLNTAWSVDLAKEARWAEQVIDLPLLDVSGQNNLEGVLASSISRANAASANSAYLQ